MLDANKFVSTVKHICEQKGIAPKTACRESGAGDNLLTNVRNGSVPSVEKVQLLALYLGCSTSELLGETEPKKTVAVSESDTITEEAYRIALAFDNADEKSRAMVRLALNLDHVTPPVFAQSDEAM